MSKKQLFKDNVLMFIGGNIANALNYFLNIILLRIDNHLFNLYTAYSSIGLILLAPSLVSMRVFTVFGNPIIENIRRYYVKNKNKVLIILIISSLLLIPFNLFLTRVTVDGTIVTSALLIVLAIIGLIANIFRGIRQNHEDYKTAVLSINLEAMGRLFLGYVFAITLDMGISGILLGHILGLVGSLLICFDRSHIETMTHNDEVRLKNIFLGTLLMTAGLEFFSNFDIIFSNHVLQEDLTAQTEFNTLQFFRKIIFFGIFTVSSIILSLGGKNRHTKRFMFIFTLGTGLFIGIGIGGVFFLFRNIIFNLLHQNITLISTGHQILFLIFTTLMSTSYLLANWLFTMKKTYFVLLPIIAAVIQFLCFILIGKDLDTVLQAFYISSGLFFLLTLIGGISEAKSVQLTDTEIQTLVK